MRAETSGISSKTHVIVTYSCHRVSQSLNCTISMVSGSSKTGVAIFLDFRLLTPASEDPSGIGDKCLCRGVRVSLTFRHKLSRTSCLPFIALTISARAGCSPFGVEISGTLSLFDPSSIDIGILQRIDCCNRSTSLANSPAGLKSPLRHVRLSMILFANESNEHNW